MKHLLIAGFFIGVSALKAQFLPFSAKNICLDRIQDVTAAPINSPKNLVVKDFNADGYDDVLIVNLSSGDISIYKNNNGIGFLLGPPIFTDPAIGQFSSIHVGEFNGVGSNLDIAICYNNSIKIFENLGGFSFTTSPSYTIPIVGYSATPSFIKAADLNKDGLDEIILVAPRNTPTNGFGIVIFRNLTVSPTYSFVQDYTKQAFQSVAPLTVNNASINFSFGDIDGDTKKDISFTYASRLDCVLFLKNTTINNLSPLTFSSVTAYKPAVIQSYAVTFGDVKTQDLIGMDGIADPIVIVSALGTGTPQPVLFGFVIAKGVVPTPTQPTIYQSLITSNVVSLQDLPTAMDLADLNNDGYKDLIGINNFKMWVYIWDPVPIIPFYPSGHFIDSPNNIVLNLPVGTVANELVSGNFDKNALPDLFFKSWKLSGNPGVIPNFSYSITTNTSDSTICFGDSALASVVLTPTAIPGLIPVVDWFKNTNTVTPQYTGNIFAIKAPGTYYPVYHFPFPYSNGPSCKITIHPIDSVRIKPISSAPIFINPANPQVCTGNSATISASGALTYTWASPSGTISTSATITGIANNYTVIGTDINGCISSQTTVVNLFQPDQTNIFTPKNQICIGDSTSLTLTAQSYTWSTGSNNSIIYVKPIVATDYTVAITDVNGCPAGKTIHIYVDGVCFVKVYTLISANGDNVNDVFTIENIDRFPNNHVDIYNRWGQRVYLTNGYDNNSKSWPSKDLNQAPSTYFYVIDLGDGSAKIKGWFELISN